MVPRFVARHGWLVAIAVAYFYVFPYFPRIHSANELPRLYLVKAIADDHTFELDREIGRWTALEGGGPTADITRVGGHSYSNKAPGSSMLAVPPYWIARHVVGEPSLATTMWICRVFAGVIPMLLFLALLYRFLERYAPDPAVRQLVCVAYGLGSMAMTYSLLFFSHQLAAICVASAWVFGLEAAERTRGRAWFAVAGALAGASALVDYQAVFAAVPAGIHVLARLRGWQRRDVAIAVGLLVGAMAIPIAILLGYHAACFGSPWRTGYGAVAGEQLHGTIAFAANHEHGVLGLTTLRWKAFVGSLFAFDNGLFALAPWFVLALPGFVLLGREDAPADPVTAAVRRRARIELGIGAALIALGIAIYLAGVVHMGERVFHPAIDLPIVLGVVAIVLGASRVVRGRERGSAAVGAGVLAIYVLFISALAFWRGGWCVGPRYITAMLPFLLPAVAALLTALQGRDRRWFGVAAGTIIVGVAIYTLSSITFPYWPDSIAHPFLDLTMRLFVHGLVSPNLGNVVGLGGLLAIAPVVIVAFGIVGYTIHRAAGGRALAIAALVAAVMFALYAAVPHGDPQARRDFVAVRASFEPLAGDVLAICEARAQRRAPSLAVYRAYLPRAVVTDEAKQLVDPFAHGTLDPAAFATAVDDLARRVDLDRCPTIDWLRSVIPP